MMDYQGIINSKESISSGRFVLFILVFALMPCLIEETYHRGILYQSASGNITAFLLSVLPFTFLHSTIAGAMSAFIFGSFMLLLMNRTKNMFYMYIIHFIYNLMSLIFNYYVTLPLESVAIFNNVVFAKDYLMYGLISLAISLSLVIPLLFILKVYRVRDKTFVEERNKVKTIFTGLILLLYFLYFIVPIILGYLAKPVIYN